MSKPFDQKLRNIGHTFLVKFEKSKIYLLLCRGLRPNRTCRIGRGRPLPTP